MNSSKAFPSVPCGDVRRVAVFADLHLTRASAAIKGGVLSWALAEAVRHGAEAVVCAGDMVGNGLADEAAALRDALSASPLPFHFTPGNAERRAPNETAAVAAALPDLPPPSGVVLLDSSAGWCEPGALDALPDGAALLAVTHVPPTSWGGESAAAWRRAVARRALSLTVAGHTHADADGDALRVTRGLDPDKALGGPPAFDIFERSGAGWRLLGTCALPGVAPEEWSDDFRRAFREDLGLSTMYDPLGGLDFAIRRQVPAVELRDASWNPADFVAVREKVAAWRAAGGRILSSHLPALSFKNGNASGVDALRNGCLAALALGCDRVTLHVPSIGVADYDDMTDAIRAAFAETLAPLAGSGVAIGVENMHMTPSDESPERRRFGYTPDECARQIALLRTIPGLRVGFHLDIGHARNNAPFSTRYPVGAWYELLGGECNGLHIHQVTMKPDGSLANHRPLTGCFAPLIALSSLLLARRDGILPRAPLFLEIRDGLGPECYGALAGL